MTAEPCGARTGAGGSCRYPAAECPWDSHRRARAKPAAGVAEAGGTPGPLATRDVRSLAWWLVERTIAERLDTPRAAVLGNLLRTLATLGPAPAQEDEALAEVELRGVLMSGMAPRTSEEWALAARIFDDEALAEFRRWAESKGEPVA